MSLRLRILLLVGAINVAVLLLVVGVGLLAGPAETIGPAAVAEGIDLALHPTLEGVQRSRYVSFVVRVRPGREEVDRFRPPEQTEAASRAEQELGRRVERGETGVWFDGQALSMIWEGASAPSRAVYVKFNERARREALSPLRSVYLFLCAGTVLLIAATYWTLSRIVLRPVERLVAASKAVAEGSPPDPVPRSGSGAEMSRLIDTFNHMAQEVHEYQRHLEERVLDALRRVTDAEHRLVIAQRLAATGSLAAGIAHEINNPLGGIANAVRRLRDADLPAAKRVEYFNLVLDGLERIRVIVERVLHFTPRQKEPAAVDAGDICRRAVDLAHHRAEKRAVRLLPPGPERVPGVVGDAQELQQAVLNLILNAIDAIPPGREGTVTAGARREGGEVVLEVTDDGVGMDEETRRRCVDIFYTTKPEGEGSGLGLAIVQHIATDHGGTLEIDSAPGKGTRVRIRLPVSAP